MLWQFMGVPVDDGSDWRCNYNSPAIDEQESFIIFALSGPRNISIFSIHAENGTMRWEYKSSCAINKGTYFTYDCR